MALTTELTRRWKLVGGADEPEPEFRRKLGLHPLLAGVLWRRGMTEPEETRRFLDPKLTGLHDPDQLPEMDRATERLERAITEKQPILLFGDYDVDGITGCAVLSRLLTALGAEVDVWIPDRFRDGYGLKPSVIERIYGREDAAAPKVIVTIDNGVMAFDAGDELRRRGVDLIVADHHRHEPGRLPTASAIVHPGIEGSEYPNPSLCGAGVSFKLAWATARRMNGGGKLPGLLRRRLLESLSLVAMGTVADVMPLTGENRILVRHGLEALAAGPTPGLGALLDVSRTRPPLDASSIGFRLGPRINAAGRLGDGRRAFDLLMTDDTAEAEALAKALDKENTVRREIESDLVDQAVARVHEVYGEEPTAAGIVIDGEGWHEGVVGIVASRIVETFHRPAIVLAVLDGGRAKGSGRSAMRVDLKTALDESRSRLLAYGGHEAAVGLTLAAEDIPAFREEFHAAVASQLGRAPDEPVTGEPPAVKVDALVELSEVDELLCVHMDRLRPFGVGHRTPVFAAEVELAGEPRLMGKGSKHLAFRVRSGRRSLRCVAWGRADLYEPLRARGELRGRGPQPFFIAFRPKLNEFRGERNVELTIVDLRFDDPELLSGDASRAAEAPDGG